MRDFCQFRDLLPNNRSHKELRSYGEVEDYIYHREGLLQRGHPYLPRGGSVTTGPPIFTTWRVCYNGATHIYHGRVCYNGATHIYRMDGPLQWGHPNLSRGGYVKMGPPIITMGRVCYNEITHIYHMEGLLPWGHPDFSW